MLEVFSREPKILKSRNLYDRNLWSLLLALSYSKRNPSNWEARIANAIESSVSNDDKCEVKCNLFTVWFSYSFKHCLICN